ncbi:MAG: hypothetical protein GY830_11125 [Bacteroidetes bacterium]|nr:hypothetical protein [Bacteroidota bacterium]
MRQSLIIGFLIIIISIIGFVYLKTWQKRTKVENFLKEENKEYKPQRDGIKKELIKNITKPKIITKSDEIQNQKNITYLKPQRTFKTKYKIISKPYIVKTHRNNKKHIFIQDEKFNIYFIDETGKLVWKRPFKEKIITEIFEIDYLKNGKRQYLFSTSKFLYLIDYNGNRVGNFPYELNTLQIPEFLNVIDYSKNKNYRIALTSKEGNIFLFDKYLKILQGWNPKSFGSPLVEKLIHMRVSKKDYLCIAKRSGEIYLIKRNGKIYDNFPLKLNKSIKGFMPIKNKNKEDSTLAILTEDNILYQHDLNGKQKLEMKPLISNEEANLIMIKDEFNLDNYLLFKKVKNNVIILNKKNEIIINKKINSNNNINIKLYDDFLFIQNKTSKNLSIFLKTKLTHTIRSDSFFSFIYNKKKTLTLLNTSEDTLEFYVI